MRRHAVILMLAIAGAVLLPPAGAAAQELAPAFPACVPPGWYGLVTADIPAGDWQSVRTYFREAGTQDWYFVEMEEGPEGFWAVLPWAEDGTAQVEMYVATVDAAGAEAISPTAAVPVTPGCDIGLTPEQAERAESLVVGETTEDQRGQTVLGFECQGIISRIWSDGTIHQDTACREVLLAATAPSAGRPLLGSMLLGAAVGGGVVLALDEEEECSCVIPPCECKDCD